MSLSRFFKSRNAPSFFVIYAHDNPALGRADARLVRDLISCFAKIGSKCRSDRSPTLSSDQAGSGARHDILENQFCLFPKEVSHTAVDKVVLFYSEALRSCCTSVEARKYIEAMKAVGLSEFQTGTLNQTEALNITPGKIQAFKARIRAVTESSVRENWFHHLLTELGLLDLRTAWGVSPWTIIAVDLHGTGTISEDLGFFGATQHYTNPAPPESFTVDQIERQHRLFFALLDQIYETCPRIVGLVRDHYREGLSSLETGRLESLAVFQMTVRFEITEDIRRFGAYTQREWLMVQEGVEILPETQKGIDDLLVSLDPRARQPLTEICEACTIQQQGYSQADQLISMINH